MVARPYRIAVIPGDGVGPEVIDVAIAVADHALSGTEVHLEWTRFDWGGDHFRRHGSVYPPNGLDRLRAFDAILLGALDPPPERTGSAGEASLLAIRRTFDQYACVRPAVLYEGVRSPLSGYGPGKIDILVFRENTEGEYTNVGGRVYRDRDDEIAVQTAVFTRRGCRRILRTAFAAAERRRRKLTSITKSNAQTYGMGLWDDVFREVAVEFPDVDSRSLLADSAAMDFVRRPDTFDVVVASNLFGDILTDLGAAITGSVGLAPSANLNPERTAPSMFEPVHGSAPDIAGRGIANPIAAVLAMRMMLEHLELFDIAHGVEQAVRSVLREGRVKTPDLGGRATTRDMTSALITALG